MTEPIKAKLLLEAELNYELKIREVITLKKKVDEKRAILNRLLKKEAKNPNFNFKHLIDPNYNFEREQTEIQSTLDDIAKLITDFEGTTSDSVYKRATGRLNHVVMRIKRIKLDPSDPDFENIETFKNESYASALQLEANLNDKVSEDDLPSPHNSTAFDPRLMNQTTCNHTLSDSHKPFPVHKLNIQFDGEPRNLLSFIENIEELSQARRITKVELFQGASDLFCKKATYWFRQIKSQVNNWESLVEKLKTDFLVSDYDDEIWNQIKSRKQGRYEPTVVFIACMEALFSRLSRTPAEVTKVKHIKLGLQTEYRRRLALEEIDTVQNLSALCKRLEEADVLSLASSSNFQSKQYASNLLDTDLNDNVTGNNKQNKTNRFNKSKNKDRKQISNKNDFPRNNTRTTPQVSSVGPSDTNLNPLLCWKCSQPNHTFRNCTLRTTKKFCFKCGCPDVVTKTCPKCQGN